MNYQRSLNISDEDPTNSFIWAWQQLHQSVENDAPPQAIVAAQTLQAAFEQLLQSCDSIASHKARSILTEIHRLLRILQRDLLFWQAAKQTRADRELQVLTTLQSIEGFYRALVCELTPNYPQKMEQS
jgi:hypothetical protein